MHKSVGGNPVYTEAQTFQQLVREAVLDTRVDVLYIIGIVLLDTDSC